MEQQTVVPAEIEGGRVTLMGHEEPVRELDIAGRLGIGQRLKGAGLRGRFHGATLGAAAARGTIQCLRWSIIAAAWLAMLAAGGIVLTALTMVLPVIGVSVLLALLLLPAQFWPLPPLLLLLGLVGVRVCDRKRLSSRTAERERQH